MVWSHVAGQYLNSFQVARRSPTQVPKPLAVRTLEEQPLAMPTLNLDHLLRMTDSTGIMQHACYSIPNNQEGYCTDDNARALILTVLLEELGKDSREVHQCASTYAAFLNYAFDSETGRFRNFMSYDRKWLEKDGSDDSQGRAIWRWELASAGHSVETSKPGRSNYLKGHCQRAWKRLPHELGPSLLLESMNISADLVEIDWSIKCENP